MSRIDSERAIEPPLLDISKLKWRDVVIPIDNLSIDSSYQRHIVERLVAVIAANYNPLLAGKIVASKRNGSTYIVDGQQRWQGAREAGIKEMAAIIITGLDQTTEAKLFLALNEGRVAVRAIDRFRAAYHAGEPYAVEITYLVEELGGRVWGIREPVKESDIQAVEALRWIHRRGGLRGLRETLEVIADGFGEISQPFCHGLLLKAIFGVISLHRDDVDRERLARKIASVGPNQIAAIAHGMGQVLGAAAGQRSYYLAVLQAYNDRMGKNAIQPAGTMNTVALVWKKIEGEEGLEEDTEIAAGG